MVIVGSLQNVVHAIVTHYLCGLDWVDCLEGNDGAEQYPTDVVVWSRGNLRLGIDLMIQRLIYY